MRRVALACSFLGSLIAAGCAPAGNPEPADGRVAETQDSISFGTPDTVHNAVVSLLTPAGGGYFSECSGSLVKIQNGVGYVLTAAHCCQDAAPTVVVRGTDYTVGAPYVYGGTPPASSGVYKVVSGSTYWDTSYNGYNHDFCMLKFSGAQSTWPTLALPNCTSTSLTDNVANGVALEHVGFGKTNKNPNNAIRMTGTNTVSSYNSTTISYQEGSSNPTGNTGIPGTCEGDSGGPALIPAGAPQANQTIVGVTSFGQTTTCGALDTGTSSRVCSGLGTGKFITNFLNDTPSGTQAGSTSTGNCDTCQNSVLSQGGACAGTLQTCLNTPACNTLIDCTNNCSDQACVNTCWNNAGTTGQNAYNAILNCICNTGCPTECSAECGGSSSSSSSSGTVTACGFQGDPTCINCIGNSCCNQAEACAANTTCVSCLSNPTTACNSNAQYTSFAQCLQGKCNAQCLGGSTSSSSSSSSSGGTSTSSSSSAGGTTTSSSSSAGGGGTMTGGGGGGAGGGGTGGGTNNQESGCSVGAAGSETGSFASLAGMLLGLLFAASRRRRVS